MLIKIVQTRIRELPGSKLGIVALAEMVIQGHVFAGVLCLADEARSSNCVEAIGGYLLQVTGEALRNPSLKLTREHQEAVVQPVIYLDTPLLPATTPMTVSLLPICTEWEGRSGCGAIPVAGLLLRRFVHTDSETCYERVGLFGLDRAQAHVLCGMSTTEECDIAGIFRREQKGQIVLV